MGWFGVYTDMSKVVHNQSCYRKLIWYMKTNMLENGNDLPKSKVLIELCYFSVPWFMISLDTAQDLVSSMNPQDTLVVCRGRSFSFAQLIAALSVWVSILKNLLITDMKPTETFFFKMTKF